jgi:TonB family protein
MLDQLDLGTSRPRGSSVLTRLAPAGPQLGVRWTKPRENFFSSLRALFAGPRPPRKFLGAPYFRDCWVPSRWPLATFIFAVVLQATILLTVHPRFTIKRPQFIAPDTQLTWYQPPPDAAPDAAPDLPQLSPKPAVRDPSDPQPAPRAEADSGADVYNPRQSIWSQPLKPNHPRQELLEPSAPDTPPKILPVLPNIVQWGDDDSAHPEMRLSPAALQRMQPANAATKQTAAVAAPDIPNQNKGADPIDIAPSASDALKPAMAVPAMSKGQAPARGGQSSAAAPAPEIGPSATADGGRVIALSETPGPAAPAPPVPQGNLQARASMSPNGGKGQPNGAGNSGVGSHAGTGPPGISISGSARLPDAPVANISGPSGAGARGSGAGSGSGEPRSEARSSSSTAAKAAPGAAASAKVALAPGAAPESLLGANRVYKLNVSMPNLSSAMGNWELSFAELNAPEFIPDGRPRPPDTDFVAPVPLQKVDPKYPPELKVEKVEGEVILYAIIRKDGSVDSIQLVQGLDPQLDANAMEALGRWKFEPAERKGEPVELVAIVHIPFHPPPPEPVY